MNERLKQFLAAENISNTQFANTLGVAKASISHILNGRNKPGYDFIQSVIEHYPSLNIEWLLIGKGKMYKGLANEKAVPGTAPSASAAPEDEPENLFTAQPDSSPASPGESRISSAPPSLQQETPSTERENARPYPAKTIDTQKHISRIIVFFNDNTFQEIR
ncbi:MAG: helix-turn-helix domain-containing protein [Candidatus Cryptobacteroides sp.]